MREVQLMIANVLLDKKVHKRNSAPQRSRKLFLSLNKNTTSTTAVRLNGASFGWKKVSFATEIWENESPSVYELKTAFACVDVSPAQPFGVPPI